MKYKGKHTITVYLDDETVNKIDHMVETESKKIRLDLTRQDILRRIISEAVKK